MISSTPRPHFTPGKDPLPILQEAGWAPGPVWTSAENLVPTRIRSRTVQPVVSLYRLSYPALFCAVPYLIALRFCFLFSSYATCVFNIIFMFFVLYFCFLFCVFFVFVLFCVLFLLVYIAGSVLIFVQVYGPLPTGGNPLAVNK